jgi:uncharacterized membrane protein YccC
VSLSATSPLKASQEWLHAHDPDYAALRRATRTALVMPVMFALGAKAIGNPILGTFAAFGSFAMLLLVDFTGSMRDRLSAQAALGVGCAVLICLGTLASRTAWLAAVGMAVIGFGVLFAGVVSSVLASASTSLLLAFILPVSLPGPASSIPDRVAGWGLAAGASLLAISLLWPAPSRNPVRMAAVAACRSLGSRLRAEIDWVLGHGTPEEREAHRLSMAEADGTIEKLQELFFATPYRPSGLATDARAVVRLVDELRWLHTIIVRSAAGTRPADPNPDVCRVKVAAAEALEQAADVLESPTRDDAGLEAAVMELRASLEELERATTKVLPLPSAPSREEEQTQAREMVTALDPSFRAQELSFVVAQIATNVAYAAAAERRSWLDRILGRQPRGLAGPLAAASQRAGSHLERHSSWLHNSLRGGAALGLAVLIADLSSVQHAFWVAFGTLSVLRSNALSTGQNVVRALLGTTAGFVVGGVIVYLIGTNTVLLWVLLPVVILFAGMAPATISFAAGQAAFTLTLLILFNLIAPLGWKIGLVRVEDIALGGAVSLAVGALFWPRGARSDLGRALAQAYRDASHYLAQAVAYGVARCDASGPTPSRPGDHSAQASAAARRLDDTFRNYLSERGAKRVRLSEVTKLVTGVAGVRLAADAVLDLWNDDVPHSGDRSAARRELESATENLTGWFDRFADSLIGSSAVPEPLAPDRVADGRLVQAVGQDLRAPAGETSATGVLVIWTGDHLDGVRRLQERLVDPARAVGWSGDGDQEPRPNGNADVRKASRRSSSPD